ncbi:lanthionine synthetase LanC family protein [Streptomyces sp. NPDC001165]|uniref:lanthionine synthetase LanC family protein n=1 Tax=Streptomyces sp. NPDC001165 TaxID=3364546 RepID=UPI0036C1CCE0
MAVSPAVCHGLAGNAEFLLDMAAVLNEPGYRCWAQELAYCAHARHTVRDGRVLLPDESMTDVSVSYNTGLSGALGMLLRLRHGGTRLWLPESLTLPPRQEQTIDTKAAMMR